MNVAVYTPDEVAARLHKSRRWLQVFIQDHPHYRLAGRTKLFTDSDIRKVEVAIKSHEKEQYERTEKAKGDPGYVYFIEAGDYIKIGYTRSIKSRIIKMMTDVPMEPKTLHLEPGTIKQEKIFHRHFASIRARGEWFRKTAELLEFIEQRKRLTGGTA
jgi:hypothetical protein